MDRFSDVSDRHESYLLGVVERLVWPSAFERLERGEPVDFGTFALSNAGVAYADRTTSWNAIAPAKVAFNWISGRSYLEMWSTEGDRFLRVNVAEIWNWPLFVGIGKRYLPAIGELKRER